MWIQEKESWHTSVTILLATLARGLSLPHSCWGHETLQLELMMAIWHPSIRSQCFWRIQRKGWLGSHGGDGDGLEMHPISRLGGLFWSSIDCVSSQEILLFQNISVLIFCRHGTCIGKLFPIIDSLHYWTDYLLLSLWILCIPVVKYVTSCVFSGTVSLECTDGCCKNWFMHLRQLAEVTWMIGKTHMLRGVGRTSGTKYAEGSLWRGRLLVLNYLSKHMQEADVTSFVWSFWICFCI